MLNDPIRIRNMADVQALMVAAGKVTEEGIAAATIDIAHEQGIPWHQAPLPRRWHWCKTQTWGWIKFDEIHRCACGAISRNGRAWYRRNERRRGGR